MSLLEARSITKTFPGVVALDAVDLTFERGEVHCIVGENGAGKSTLVKTLTGIYKPDGGTLHHDGKERPAIGYVPQELNLFDHMTVAENMFLPLGHSGSDTFLFHRREIEKSAVPFMERLKMTCAPNDCVRDISVAEKQLLQIARALASNSSDIIILDEPTASLTKSEIERLFVIIEELQASGVAIVFITHRLDEVMRLHSVVSVLRNGKVVGNSDGERVSEAWIVEKMTGKDMDLSNLYRPRTERGARVVRVEGLSGDGFEDISFDLHQGEVLGFAGLVGAGRSEILQTLFGIRKKRTGLAWFRDERWNFGKPPWSIARGIIYLPEERKSHGIFPHLSVRQNIGVGLLRDIAQGGIVRDGRERELAKSIIGDYQVKTASAETKIMNLSGGNQQKVLIGRSLMAQPNVMIFDEPTRGIDVNAKDEIYQLMQKIAEEQGIAIVLVSSEIEELIKCSNRVLSIYDGRINDEISGDDLTEERLLSSIINAPTQTGAQASIKEENHV
ncbi:sugar ABC transporter ATP-binding protein [Roseovarius sp. MMSF_3281]|uniref:sugar ABC transporter ATP-binding protein n=1 Tax=Roseovarius sp. MMSF_3281 TaxID=3046694 RepID=UPI00273CFC2B|nr:sugar ABC transporter ATP-binding protein [Roseovarius sp. MMSF_3281]